jgi:hypothetical protein
MGNGNLKLCMTAPINGRDVYGTGRPSGGVCTIGAAETDMQATLQSRQQVGRKYGQQGRSCDCDQSLTKQLERMLPFSQ